MKNEENILSKIDFEEKSFLLDSFENSLKLKENLISNFNELNSSLFSSKIIFKSNCIEHNGSPNEIGDREYNLISEFNFKTVFTSYGGCISKYNKHQITHLPRVYLHER